MKKFFHQLFDDNNSINEKSVVGFIAFVMLCLAFLVDIITGYFGKEFVVNKVVFDGFMVLVLGSFGIASIDKWTNRKKDIDSPKEEEEEG
jgi:ABC-type uncharacterized transport system permease subunit